MQEMAVLGLSVWEANVGYWFWVGGHSIGTATGLLLRIILCKSLIFMH